MSRIPVLLAHWCHACAHRGRAVKGPRRPFSLPPPQSLFPEWMNLSEAAPIVSHNRQRLSQFYAAFPVRGGSLSAGIERLCDATGTTRGCPSNTTWLWEKRMKGREEAQRHTHTHTLSMTCIQSMIGRQRFKPCKEDNFIGDHLKKTKQDIYIKASWHLLSHTSLSLGFDQLQHVLT